MATSIDPPKFEDLSLSAQTNFAELVEQAQARMLDARLLFFLIRRVQRQAGDSEEGEQGQAEIHRD